MKSATYDCGCTIGTPIMADEKGKRVCSGCGQPFPLPGTPATRAASALAEALLTPGNATISIFAAHGGGDDDAPTRWTVVWAKGPEADRLRAWLGDDDQEDPDG